MDFIKRKINNLVKKSTLKKITNNMGEIVEGSDKFICYIKQEKLNKSTIGYRNNYCLNLYGLYGYKEGVNRIKKKYNLNKPIYYVFDNIVFDKMLSLSTAHCNVIIKNCTFTGDIELRWNQNITFENNRYEATKPLNLVYNCYLYSRGYIENITFINENICDSKDSNNALYNFGVELKADNVKLIDTNINVENPEIYMKGHNVSLKNSSISGEEVYLDCDKISLENSLIKGEESVTIKNENNDFNGKIISPIVVYNNIDFSQEEGLSYIDKEIVNQKKAELFSQKELKNARSLFIQKLNNIRDNCKVINDEEIERLRNNLESKSVHKVLSRTK